MCLCSCEKIKIILILKGLENNTWNQNHLPYWKIWPHQNNKDIWTICHPKLLRHWAASQESKYLKTVITRVNPVKRIGQIFAITYLTKILFKILFVLHNLLGINEWQRYLLSAKSSPLGLSNSFLYLCLCILQQNKQASCPYHSKPKLP